MLSSARLKIAIALLFAMTLAGCATSSSVQTEFDPATQARIRVFHGTAAYLYLGDVCDGNTHPVIHAAAGGFSYFERNKKIGVPATDDMPFSYHEYAIPANEPLTVKMYWQAQNASGTWERCGPLYTTFTPNAGQNYDTFMQFHRGVCQGVKVRKLVMHADDKATTIAAPLNGLPFRHCN
ncbi:hypothetical protein EV677_2243 [Herminiimonas fonticola]|uniref:Lipoprotein n=1 Tax=Herminiimonas fonticola TaxID=303380 RepID=A0A4R6G6P1_9BURK|nr:hypothetical protein Hfont_1979 [Herminiimonas fonticola]TDN90167.1 hypothetical protein EV677_2243 [Herminiimonas fonticola]